MTAQLDVPELVRQRAMSNGVAGRRWLDDLPELVAVLADRWDLEIGTSFRGGTAAFVAAATDRSGRACVLKVAAPLGPDRDDEFSRSVLVHQLARGWRPVADDCDLPTGAEKAMWLADYITMSWEELDEPCPRDVIDRAVAYCDDRAAAFDPSQAVLVHGDAHGWNTLHARERTYKLVDPEGVRSDRAHDLSVAMREYNHPLLVGDTPRLVRERAELLASWCEVEPEPVWQWGFIERVSTGLASVRELRRDEGMASLEVATRCL